MNNQKAETLEAWGLGLAGLSLGVFKEVIQPELTAKRGWIGIGLGVLAYELSAKDGELLSHGVDRALEEHPVATRLAIGVTALHLLNIIPEKVDPYVQVPKIISAVKNSQR